MKKALRSVGGVYYDFTGNFIPEGELISRAGKKDELVPNRRSPRLSYAEIEALRGGGNPAVLASAIARIVAPPPPQAPPSEPKQLQTREQLKAKIMAIRGIPATY